MANDKEIAVNKNMEITTNLHFTKHEDFFEFCSVIAKGKLSPLKSREDVAIAIIAGKQLGISWVSAVNNIYPIEGRATLGIHIMQAICLKNKIVTKVIRDAQPLYAFAKFLKEGQVDRSYPTRYSFETKPLEGETMSPTPVDYVTTLSMKRIIKMPDGSFETIEYSKTFKRSDAERIVNGAGQSVLETKSAWKNYFPDMLYASAWRPIAKKIADDLFQGMYETTEMLDTSNIDYDMNESGKVVIKDKDGNVVVGNEEIIE